MMFPILLQYIYYTYYIIHIFLDINISFLYKIILK
jgi:hypothetical protein